MEEYLKEQKGRKESKRGRIKGERGEDSGKETKTERKGRTEIRYKK